MRAFRYQNLVITTIVFIITPLIVSAQEEWGTSTSVCVSKKISKVSIALEEEFRLRENFSTADRFSTSLDLSYKPWKYLKVGGAYNLINHNHETKGWEVRHRYYFYATGNYSFNRFNISLRERFQSTYRAGVKETAKRANPKLFLRSRLKLEYDIKKSKLEPYASVEFFSPLNDPVDNSMDKIRYTAGTNYKLNKRNKLDFFYRYNNFMDDDDIGGQHVIGLGYSYSF
ncbi:MAG: DUF2490 domain-containing protein [Tannerella sp.]|jgi:hypothetical protein|nr:DUF2490 domain-containing protein [Tannerella sp.]